MSLGLHGGCLQSDHQMMWIAILLGLSINVFADKVSYPVQKISARGIKAIEIRGVNGALKIKARPGPFYQLAVRHSRSKRYEDWQLQVERRGTTLYLEVFSVAYGSQWKKFVKREQWPEFDVDWRGPSLPTVVSWRDGKIAVTGWRDALEASLLKGDFQISDMKGRLKLQTGDVALNLSRVEGQTDIRGEKGSLKISRSSGPFEISWLDGSIDFDQVKGPMNLESQQAEFKGIHGQGPWSIKMASGRADLRNFSGSLKAEGRSAPWTLDLRPPSDLEIKSASGSVDIRAAAQSGLKAFLTSKEGPIETSGWLKNEVRDGVHVAEGRRPGSPINEVFVKTQSGSIHLSPMDALIP